MNDVEDSYAQGGFEIDQKPASEELDLHSGFSYAITEKECGARKKEREQPINGEGTQKEQKPDVARGSKKRKTVRFQDPLSSDFDPQPMAYEAAVTRVR